MRALKISTRIDVWRQWTLAAWALASCGGIAASAEPDPNAFLRFQSFQTHSRVTFRVDAAVPVTWEDTSTGFTAFFKGATLVDFGAPFGDEERWASSFANIDNPRLSAIHFRETSDGVRVEGTWRFATGPRAPAEPHMETFNYREANPPRFIVDFWPKAGATVAEIQAAQVVNAKKAAMHRAREQVKQRVERRIASTRAKEQMDDLTRFCREPLKDGRDIFLPFLPVHEKLDFVKYLPTRAADQDFSYFRPQAETEDAQYVRLALDLYKEEKYALVLRTLDFLNAEYSKNPFVNEMSFLRANATFKLGLAAGPGAPGVGAKEEGERLLTSLRLDAKGTPVAFHAALFLAVKTLEKNSPLATAETFSWLIQNYPENHLGWVFHLAVAESLYEIQQIERATHEYQWVVDHGPDEETKALAAFRIGDLYMNRRQYEQALGAYVRGIRYFPKQAAKNPAVYLNRAEALVGLEEYGEAKTAFAKYLEDFSAFPEGWRAALRIGEIAARRGDAASQLEARSWYYQTVNRFPFSAGSTLARIRLAPCGDHGGFTEASAERFFAGEAKSFDWPGAVLMAKYPEFRAQARIRTLIAMGRDEKAMTAIAEERPHIHSKDALQEADAADAALFRRAILAKLHGGKTRDFYDALAFYKTGVAAGVAAPNDPDYLLELSHAASDLGLGNLAAELAEHYHKAAKRGLAEAAPAAGIGEKLKISDQRFAEAEALWISRPAGSANRDAEIREKLDQVVLESRYALEKEVILGLLEQGGAKPASALTHAAKAELLAAGEEQGAGPHSDSLLRLRGWLASLEGQVGDSTVALDLYRGLENQLKARAKDGRGAKSASLNTLQNDKLTLLGLPALPNLEQILLGQGMIHERNGHWSDAAAAYGRAVEGGLGGNQALYGYARALLKSGGAGNHHKALAMLEKVSVSKQQDFWKDLAVKTLEVEKESQGGL